LSLDPGHALRVGVSATSFPRYEANPGVAEPLASDPRVIETARAKGVKVHPLVMNLGFDQPTIHRVLNHPEARAQAMRSLAALCRDNRFDGIQFDFENFHLRDKDAFTSFTREAVDSVHRAGCQLSAAVVPRFNEDPGTNSYDTWIYENWRAAFDYKALSDTLDFISYMTYAQHTGGSPPGPVAGFEWMKACLEYVLSLGVPPSKISLGLAGYSYWWYPAYDDKNGSRLRGDDISYVRAMQILDSAGVRTRWDDIQKSPYAMWESRAVPNGSNRVHDQAGVRPQAQPPWVLGLAARLRGSSDLEGVARRRRPPLSTHPNMLPHDLEPVAIRVLGSLIEKEPRHRITTRCPSRQWCTQSSNAIR
jgi:spore germination protein YaaH